MVRSRGLCQSNSCRQRLKRLHRLGVSCQLHHVIPFAGSQFGSDARRRHTLIVCLPPRLQHTRCYNIPVLRRTTHGRRPVHLLSYARNAARQSCKSTGHRGVIHSLSIMSVILMFVSFHRHPDAGICSHVFDKYMVETTRSNYAKHRICIAHRIRVGKPV